MRVQRRHRRQNKCPHRTTVSIVSSGVQRLVCESCGHVSVHFMADLGGEVERTRFARNIERGQGAHLPELGYEDEEPDDD